MPTIATTTVNTKLRHNEYYGQQNVFDELYESSLRGAKFKKLYEKIIQESNILLAYRNIKANTGSTTKGTDGKTIQDIAAMTNEQVVAMVQGRLKKYVPESVRRVEIFKPNGKIRPLGIATISDRLIQQCILQILEPICEAKFHNHSFGFRPNRSTEHAKAMMHRMINLQTLHFVVDIDILGFFDNVEHGKLLKQMWTIGIQDKKLICIISAMLKAEIAGVGISNQGVPQGGLLSPLLSNVVLNELDWWISDQWESFETSNFYKHNSSKTAVIRKSSKLKECHIIRYADDFKIMCRTRDEAERIFIAIKLWLKERLNLEISPDKSKITNLRKKTSEFLGFSIKAVVKGKKRIANSKIKSDAITKIMAKGKELIKKIQKNPTLKNVGLYNSYVLGIQNYYRIATHCNLDFSKIGYYLDKISFVRWKSIATNKGSPSKVYLERYKGCNKKKTYINGQVTYPMSACKTKNAMCFSKKINKYTSDGRRLIHKQIEKISELEFIYLVKNPIDSRSIEYNDNRISLFSAQCGRCRILEERLEVDEFHCHHIKQLHDGGSDKYNNLVIVHPVIHRLIHATKADTIHQMLAKLELSKEQIVKVNRFRLKVGNIVI
ncbi:reverse transcriptase family protein [Desulfosporosinus sp. OT]|nr:reverse transcriptase family protein [Desulfosporosinus sp. OT]